MAGTDDRSRHLGWDPGSDMAMILLTDLHIALIASFFSSVGWIVGATGIIYVPVLFLTGRNWELGILVMIAAILIGAGCAKIEHRYNRISPARKQSKSD